MPLSRLVLVALTAALTFALAAVPAVQPPAPARAPEDRLQHAVVQGPYMPLMHGHTYTYADPTGDSFTLSFGAPLAVIWFDQSLKEVTPMSDSRCGCQFLLQVRDGQVEAIGLIEGGRIQQWGEPVVIFPAEFHGRLDTVVTSAGRFQRAARYEAEGGTAWFAPGVGLIKVDEYSLVRITPPS